VVERLSVEPPFLLLTASLVVAEVELIGSSVELVLVSHELKASGAAATEIE